ncbi:hypothetical protein K493DRAFT_234427, partial [Basidiobolus meristosporus CBS 931.73]
LSRVKSLLDFLGAFIFILGNYFLFTSVSCEMTSPSLFGMSLVMVVLGYFLVAIPVLLCGAAVFCLPCALVVTDLAEFRLADPEEAMCTICLDEYSDGELIRRLHCKHHFHQQCLDEWLLINRYCPLCKANACPTAGVRDGEC